jgi:hypothetical protein
MSDRMRVNDLAAERSEELRFDEVVVFYSQVFDLGSNVNPTEAARALLREDFALVAPNYITDEFEVADRFKDLKRLRSSAEALSDLGRSLDAGGLRGAARWALHHPTRSLRLLPLFLRRKKARNPSRQDQEGDAQVREASHTESAAEGLEPAEERAVRFMDDAMRRLGWVESLQRHVDRDLFKPQYLGDVPFTRIGLQPFFATIWGEQTGVDVGLLVHRSGVAILTFYVSFEGQMTADELLSIENLAPEDVISETRVARAVVEPQARIHGLRDEELDRVPSEREYSSGVEWFVYRDHRDASLVDVFDMYRIAVASSLQGEKPVRSGERPARSRDSGWMVYPVVFARRVLPSIPDSAAFAERYPREIAGLVQRTDWRGLTDENVKRMAEGNLSIRKDHSLYVEAGHATVFYLDAYRRKLTAAYGDDAPGQSWLASQFQTSVVVDVLLIQRWILTTLNVRLGSLTSDPARLNALKRDLLVALEEYHNIAVSYGSAQEIIRLAREKMGTDDLYQTLMRKLDVLDRLIEAKEAGRRAWRDRLLKAATAVATLLLGLPAASRVAEVVGAWDPVSPDAYGTVGFLYNGFISFVDAHPAGIAIAIYLLSVCVVLPWIVLSLLPTRGRRWIVQSDQSHPAHDEGFAWPQSSIVWQERSFEEEARRRDGSS